MIYKKEVNHILSKYDLIPNVNKTMLQLIELHIENIKHDIDKEIKIKKDERDKSIKELQKEIAKIKEIADKEISKIKIDKIAELTKDIMAKNYIDPKKFKKENKDNVLKDNTVKSSEETY